MATFQVTASTDDAWRRLTSSNFSRVLTSNIAGADNTTYQNGSGMRFLNITIPKEATINSAKITLRCKTAKAGVACNTRISAEDVDDAPTFANDLGAFDTRWAARTTARMDWDAIPAWTQDVDYDSPTTDGVTTFASIIQEVIDRASWASGNDIVIFWDDFDDRSDHNADARRDAYAYDSSTEFAPKLVITYTVPAKRGWLQK